MTHEAQSSAEGEPIPRLRLQEGIDYIDQVELHRRLMQENMEQGGQETIDGRPVNSAAILEVELALE